jgi:hypothetical protein
MSNANVATYRYMAEQREGNKIVSNADIYAGPFGEVEVVPNRVMANSAAVARNAFLADTEMLSWKWLRPIANVPNLAKTGDAEKGVILGEGTLEVKNEAGLGVIADLFGLTAAS